MGIADIRTKINQFQNDPLAFVQNGKTPSPMFSFVLQQKMSTVGKESDSTTGTAIQAENSLNQAEIYVQNTLTGDISIFQNGQNTAFSNTLTNNAAINGQCQQCSAEQAVKSYGMYSNNTVNAAGLPQNTGLTEKDLQKAAPYMQHINEASERYGMPVNLILGIMKSESNFNNECVSYAGAKGLMQLMPETAAEVGVTDEFDSRQNILGSVEYVTKLINKYDGDVRLALAAYNTGPGKIARRGVTSSTSAEYLTVPQSIRDYADRVLKYAGYQD